MKRSAPLRRKTPIKTHSQLKRRTAIGSKSRPKSSVEVVATNNPRNPKSYWVNRGLKGHGRSKADIKFHNLVAKLGCIACKKLNIATLFPVRIHHVDGRNKGKVSDMSERRVLPLCDQHHNPQLAFPVNGVIPDIEAPSVHCRKKLFVSLLGTEEDLVLEVYQQLGMTPPWIAIEETK